MPKNKKTNEYKWTYASVGGTVRVKISSGEDIRHLPELDKKLWTVLSSPTEGMEFDPKTLAALDSDGDGRIRVDEVMAAATSLTCVLRNPDILLEGRDSLNFSDFSDGEEGQRLLASSRQILKNLGIEKEDISLAETADNVAIFAKTLFNGDGIVTPASAGGDEALSALIGEIVTCMGGLKDRSGEDGADTDKVEAFYGAAAAYKAWKDSATKETFPYGDGTQAALEACNGVAAKIDDWFMRCKLIDFDTDAKDAVDVSVDKIGAIAGEVLSDRTQGLEEFPIARPDAGGKLPLARGINPAWKAAVSSFKALVVDPVLPGAETLDEAQWNSLKASFAPYCDWMAAKAGAEVEALGDERIAAILKEDRKADVLALIEKDKALEQEALSIESVDRLLRLSRDFCTFLNNYLVLADFYDPSKKAIFQCGRLYIDQRSTDLCMRVLRPGNQADISSLSGMYILYCTCTSQKLGKSMNILAVLTAGDTRGIRPGKNAVFYDRDGNDWDAVVTSIVENPISLKEAFWAPYRKVGKWVSDKIDKSAAEKDSKSLESLTSSADSATTLPADGAAPKPAFDIAKFAGIFAAIGMALGVLGAALAGIIASIKGLAWWKLILIIVVIMLVISLPSVFITWRKLRRRDLGPVLNANGWAVNAKALVSVKFGKTLTSLAKFPKLTEVDKEERRKQTRRWFWWCFAIILAAAAAFATIRFCH